MKYKKVDLPVETWEEFKRTQDKMSDAYKQLTGREKQVPLTKVMEIKAKQPTFLFDGELVKIFKKGKMQI